MNYSDIKIFKYKKIKVIFKIEWKDIGFVKKEYSEPIQAQKATPSKKDRVIDSGQKYYNIDKLFKTTEL